MFRRTITQAEKACRGNATALMRFARQTDINLTRPYLPALPDEVRTVSRQVAREFGKAMDNVIPLGPRLKKAS